MNSPTTLRLVVIGGGATGTGIARDAAERGFAVTLVEQGELGSGTSGNFHGILHSGARYAVLDEPTASECYRENQILRRIVPSAIIPTGGLFVALNEREAAHATLIMQACQRTGIPATEITPAAAHILEPNLTTSVLRAFTVPDGFVDGGELIRLNREAAEAATRPATLLTGHRVIGFARKNSLINHVSVLNQATGKTTAIPCDYVINAGGVWAGEVARMVSITLDMVFDKGTMIMFENKLNTAVLNRCRPQADGDLLDQNGTQSIMGTTARVITKLSDCQPTAEEVQLLLTAGFEMVPAMKTAVIRRVYAGVRPLFNDGTPTLVGSTRSISRSYHVLDHEGAGLDNFISVVGGKVTIYRLMAEMAVDLLCRKSGVEEPCRTADLVLETKALA